MYSLNLSVIFKSGRSSAISDSSLELEELESRISNYLLELPHHLEDGDEIHVYRAVIYKNRDITNIVRIYE